MTYTEKLKSPEWQKKRLEILQRDNFVCCRCLSGEKELHVHHHFYKPNKDPWDYHNDNFITYCVNCHKEKTEMINKIKEIIFQITFCFNSCHPVLTVLEKELEELKEAGFSITQNYNK